MRWDTKNTGRHDCFSWPEARRASINVYLKYAAAVAEVATWRRLVTTDALAPHRASSWSKIKFVQVFENRLLREHYTVEFHPSSVLTYECLLRQCAAALPSRVQCAVCSQCAVYSAVCSVQRPSLAAQ